MLRYIIKEKKEFLLFLVLMPLRALSSVAVMTIIASIIDFAMGGSLTQLPKYIMYFGVYILVDFLINVFDAKIHFTLIQKSTSRLKQRLFQKMMWQDKDVFHDKSSTYLSVIENDVEVLREVLYTIMDMMEDFMRMFFATLIVFYYSWQIGLFILLTSFLQAFIPIAFGKKLEHCGEEYTIGQERHIATLKDYLASYTTTKLFHIEPQLARNYGKTVHEVEAKWKEKEFLSSFVNSFSYVFNKIAYLGIFLVGGYLLMIGSIRLSIIVAITNVVSYISGPSLYLVDDLAKIKAAQTALFRIEKILNQEMAEEPTDEPPIALHTIQLVDVSFAYEKKSILKAVSYRFEHNQKYLIVGESGAGKTTFLNLLSGLEKKYTGKILYNNMERKRISGKNIAKNICLIEQTPFLFKDTILNNITLFEPFDTEEVKQALAQVGLLEYVLHLEDGLQTVLFENGSNLSGGEKQRLALARALLRKTPFILLDEYTSNLDKHALEQIEQCVFSLQDVTVIVVSHRSEEKDENYQHVIRIENGQMVSCK